MKRHNILLLIAFSIIAIGLASCTIHKGSLPTYFETEVPLILEDGHATHHYTGLNYGLHLSVKTSVENENIIDVNEISSYTGAPGKRMKSGMTRYIVTPQLRQFVESSMSRYIRSMGININTDIDSDLTLSVNVTEFRLRISNGHSAATVVIEYQLLDRDGTPTVARTLSTGRVSMKKDESFASALERAYASALDGMDWDLIASRLKTHRRSEQEPDRNVSGDGNTALENTVIRWYIISAPQGADVSWRVISSTPEVKNTNSTYVGTTPYETTETFDIRGLSHNNAGNVQIEVTCEKPGYLTQRRRFNLRQAIEQKEISAKFNLVKEE